MKTICKNDFTGYRAEIIHKGETPSAYTIAKHYRRSKASDCLSKTSFVREDGVAMEVYKGEVIVYE